MSTVTTKETRCDIYGVVPKAPPCRRIRLTVEELHLNEEGVYVPTDYPLRSIDQDYSRRAEARLLDKVDQGIKPPTPRPRKAASDA